MRSRMNLNLITLGDETIEIVVDPAHGADVLTLRHRASGVDVLFSTPWRTHADGVVAGTRSPTTTDPIAGYVERYRGGWNTLCPNAGEPRTVHGAPVGFHGEVVKAQWDVVQSTADSVQLRLTLFSVPVVINREIRVEDGGVVIADELSNLSDVPLDIDYVSHPAFGGRFIEGDVRIDTNARAFNADPATKGGPIDAGTTIAWPGATAGVDLRDLPDEPRALFGWLSEFDGRPWAMVTNRDLGLAARVTWDGTHLPYAWFWQELSGTEDFPWYRRARVVAVEPASTATSGLGRARTLHLEPRQSLSLRIAMCLIETEELP